MAFGDRFLNFADRILGRVEDAITNTRERVALPAPEAAERREVRKRQRRRRKVFTPKERIALETPRTRQQVVREDMREERKARRRRVRGPNYPYIDRGNAGWNAATEENLRSIYSSENTGRAAYDVLVPPLPATLVVLIARAPNRYELYVVTKTR